MCENVHLGRPLVGFQGSYEKREEAALVEGDWDIEQVDWGQSKSMIGLSSTLGAPSPMSYVKSSHQNEVALSSKSSWPSSPFGPFFNLVPTRAMPRNSLFNSPKMFVFLRELAAYTHLRSDRRLTNSTMNGLQNS